MPDVPPTAYAANARMGARHWVRLDRRTRLVRYSTGSIGLTYRGWGGIVEYHPDGAITVLPPASWRTRDRRYARGEIARIRAVLPPDWSLEWRRRGPSRWWVILCYSMTIDYGGILTFTRDGGVLFGRPDAHRDGLTAKQLQAEVRERQAHRVR